MFEVVVLYLCKGLGEGMGRDLTCRFGLVFFVLREYWGVGRFFYEIIIVLVVGYVGFLFYLWGFGRDLS